MEGEIEEDWKEFRRERKRARLAKSKQDDVIEDEGAGFDFGYP